MHDFLSNKISHYFHKLILWKISAILINFPHANSLTLTQDRARTQDQARAHAHSNIQEIKFFNFRTITCIK